MVTKGHSQTVEHQSNRSGIDTKGVLNKARLSRLDHVTVADGHSRPGECVCELRDWLVSNTRQRQIGSDSL